MARGKDLEAYIEETTSNIRKDRDITKHLLNDLILELKTRSSPGANHEYGLIAAKYVETLQRSNEQLVKLAALIQKNSKSDEGLSSEDKQELFDMINSGGD